MTAFLLEIFTPLGSMLSAEALRVQRAAEAVARRGVVVRYVRSILVPEDETCFHLFEAQSASAVELVVEHADLQHGRIAEAVSESLDVREHVDLAPLGWSADDEERRFL